MCLIKDKKKQQEAGELTGQRESSQQQSECVHHREAGDVTSDAPHRVQEQTAGQKYTAHAEDLHQDIMWREWLMFRNSVRVKLHEVSCVHFMM